ncbi:hypothetical protein OUZ56_001031 [Daphnia magna]|uniref:Odorant receptor n=1 Tax=Daphnia magna TaxID=35525 RepID=A0ABR0A1F2_9CRUS|nr:hypothetical protein OUZ56_001031 [Daphnia magna]
MHQHFNRMDNIKMMKRNAMIFDHLCRASSELNSIFSLPALFVLAIKFVTVISTTFAYTYRFIVTNILLENAIWIYSFLCVTESIRILILLSAADMPVKQVRLLHERVTAMSLSGFAKTIAEKITMMILLVQVDEDRVHLSAGGLFKVGAHLIPALHPFVSLCQACGLIPYTMKRNSTSGKFELVVGVRFLSDDLQDVLWTDRNIPITLIILSGVTSSSFLAQLLSSRWIALNYRHLDNAVKAVQEVERLFGEKFLLEHKSSIMTRFVAGFAAVMTTAIVAILSMGPLFVILLPENVNVFSLTAMFMILASVNVMFDSSLLFVHISYYITAYYIQLISFRLKKEDHDEFQQAVHKGTDQIKMMKQNALIFDHLCRASSELNSIFSLPAFFLLSIKFVTVISTAFAYTQSFIYRNAILENAIWIYPFLFLTESVRIFFLLAAADMPVHQVRVLHERVTTMSLSGFSKTMAEKIAVSFFILSAS